MSSNKETRLSAEQRREIVDEIVCPKHGMAYEECCLSECLLKIHKAVDKAAILALSPTAKGTSHAEMDGLRQELFRVERNQPDAATRMRNQIVERVKAKVEEYRGQGERWHQKSRKATNSALKEMDHDDGVFCFTKMQALIALATEIATMELAPEEGGEQP